jgi:2-dehydropantoate 2-reductase
MDAIHVVGAGGIGCAVGYALRAAGVPVRMVERDPRKVEAGRRDGLIVEGQPPLQTEFIPFDDWRPEAGATVLLCTKCYDNAAALERIPETANLIPIQNGFEALLEGRGHALEGIASFVSECAPDRPATRITRKGKLHLGPAGTTYSPHGSPGSSALASPLRKSRLFPVIEVHSITPYKFTKLMYNAAISPLAAAAGIDNGQLLSVPATRRLFFAFIQENYGILAGAGIELGKIGPFHPRTVAAILRRKWVARLLARAFEPSLRGTYCSMAPDLPHGRTEIDNYNGKLVELAGERPCPLNRAAVRIVKRMERERILPGPDVLAEFTAALDSAERSPPALAAVPGGALRPR